MKLQLIQAPMHGCDDHAKLMAHMSLGNSVAGEHHLGFPSRYVVVLFAYFDYLLESFGVQDLSIWRISVLK